MKAQKTPHLTAEQRSEKWWVIDATDLIVGRLATEVASLLRGKNKGTYTPHTDSGDSVIVVNSDKVRFSGQKMDTKVYYRHSGYPGGLKTRTAREQLERDSTEIVRKAVWGMIPKGALGRQQIKKLKVFSGADHSHESQNPEQYQIHSQARG